jgi:thymidylate synthase (FAD)
MQRAVINTCQEVYKKALERGVAKEVARKVLPEGLTKSRMYMKGSLRSWIHYLEVRGEGSGTQKEHMLVAAEIAKVITQLFPVSEELKNEL